MRVADERRGEHAGYMSQRLFFHDKTLPAPALDGGKKPLRQPLKVAEAPRRKFPVRPGGAAYGLATTVAIRPLTGTHAVHARMVVLQPERALRASDRS